MIFLAFEIFFCQFVTFSLQGLNSFELSEKQYGKVILVNTIFRHGERSVTHSYPTDPYRAYKWPDGEGQLTQVGKERVFEEGKWFKQHYRRLLETVNSHTNISMISSGIDRTIMSGECFLASFFTPKSSSILTEDLKWHAVPVHSNLLSKYNVLKLIEGCEMYDASLKKYYKSKLAKNIFHKYQKNLFQVLGDHSGFKFSQKNMSDCYDKMDYVHDTLSVQDAANFKLPSWTTKIFPEPLNSAKSKLFIGAFGTQKMKKLSAGPLLTAIRENMIKKHKNKSTQIFHFYSAHDHTLMYVMNALKIFNNKWPPYRSSLVFELREKKGDKFVMIFFKNSTTASPIYLQLPQCKKERICRLITFLKETKHLIPKNMDLECKIPKNNKQ